MNTCAMSHGTLLHSKIRHQLRMRVICDQEVMTDRTVVGYTHVFLCIVIAVVAAEASWIVIMSEIVRVGAPANVHEGKDVGAVDYGQRMCRLLDLRTLSVPYSRISRTIEGDQI